MIIEQQQRYRCDRLDELSSMGRIVVVCYGYHKNY